MTDFLNFHADHGLLSALCATMFVAKCLQRIEIVLASNLSFSQDFLEQAHVKSGSTDRILSFDMYFMTIVGRH